VKESLLLVLCAFTELIVHCTDAVLAQAFKRAQMQSSLSLLSNTFLVHLGLIKVHIIAYQCSHYLLIFWLVSYGVVTVRCLSASPNDNSNISI